LSYVQKKGRAHLLFNDEAQLVHASLGHCPPASLGSSLVAIGAFWGFPLNAKYGCVSMMMRSEPGRKPAQDETDWKPSWMLMKGPLPAPRPVIVRIMVYASR
jgi:hypothetical protein